MIDVIKQVVDEFKNKNMTNTVMHALKLMKRDGIEEAEYVIQNLK